MAIISGVLQDALGNPINGSITLRAKRTTGNVIGDTYVKINVDDGNYSFDLQPCEYDVVLTVEGYPKNHLNTITVYTDSPDGTLNDYLINPPNSDSMPEFLAQVLNARNEAKAAAEEARGSADGTVVLNKLSSSDGSAKIGHYGSNVQSVMDSNGQLHYWIAQMAAGKRVNIICYGDSTTD
ncbi:prophage tail fiber N-terminal domain-containing protein, partial [Gilliamella apicola]|uniref:prophage tail fiber N-terminal domain-containing protein n=1 Tax=Gilliamella apicola TaxID=1196095 RepID=UPI000B744505